MHKHAFSAVAFAAVLWAGTSAHAGDWFRWRGPDLNGISKETGWFKPWSGNGPKQIWKANVGPGYSTVSVADGRLFTCGSANKKETVFCLDEKTGKKLWSHTYATAFVPQYYDGGSSGTPTVDKDGVYHLAQMGELFCFEAATGRVVWSNNIVELTGTKVHTWGLSGAPLVDGGLLILNVGSAGAAVEKATGKVLWKSAGEGGYATPVPFHDSMLIFGTKALTAVDRKTGKQQWEFPWKTLYDVNAADPIVVSDSQVFISSDYDHGSALLEVKGNQVRAVWETKNMKNPFASSVLLNGFIYGISAYAGKPNGTLRCIDAKSGDLKWSEASIGNGALMAADGKLIVMSEKGELVIAEATPLRFKPLSRAQVLGGTCWTMPVLSRGKIFARNSRGDLVCVDPSHE